jgi:hypothetical protein
MVDSNEKYKEYRRTYYLKNKEKFLEASKKRYLKIQADPELKKKRMEQITRSVKKWKSKNPEKTNKYTNKAYQNHPEKYKLASSLWRINNREKHLKARRKWAQENPEKIKLSSDKYKTKAIIKRRKNYLMSDIDLKKKKTIW